MDVILWVKLLFYNIIVQKMWELFKTILLTILVEIPDEYNKIIRLKSWVVGGAWFIKKMNKILHKWKGWC